LKKKINVPDDVEVTRYSLMLEDWHWGIIFWQEIAYFINGNNF
jgi:hypothetical protein